MDDSHREAGTMDAVNFATKLDVKESGIIETIEGYLLGWDGDSTRVKAEPYELNVYGRLP